MTQDDTTQDAHKKYSVPKYSVPAVEKALDILELLSTQSTMLTQTQIAKHLGQSPSGVFRTLECLKSRGYIAHEEGGSGYHLTMQLHRLVDNFPITNILINKATAPMHALCERTNLSCHLSVPNGGKIYIIHQAKSPLPISLDIKIGAEFSLHRTASGRVLLAFQDIQTHTKWLNNSMQDGKAYNVQNLQHRLDTIRKNGYEISGGDRIQGLQDISCPILNTQGVAIAALTVPFLDFINDDIDIEYVKWALIGTCTHISTQIDI